METFNVQTTTTKNLKALIGEIITLQLASGQEIQGKVKDSGDSLLHIEELSGKDFYDALISINQISAIIMQVRN